MSGLKFVVVDVKREREEIDKIEKKKAKGCGTGRPATCGQSPVHVFWGTDGPIISDQPPVHGFEAQTGQLFLTSPLYVVFWGTGGPIISDQPPVCGFLEHRRADHF